MNFNWFKPTNQERGSIVLEGIKTGFKSVFMLNKHHILNLEQMI